MIQLSFRLIIAISLLCTATTGLADWGREPYFAELHSYQNVSIGFAAQNLKSPISNFGHTFLVFHNDGTPEADSLVVEFTGEATDLSSNISALLFSVPGKYSLSYLSQKRMQYDLENRSLWLYKLALSQEETERLKDFLIRSESHIFEYDFSQKNCAFYINYAILKARSTLVFKRDGLFVTPIGTLRWARTEGLISSSLYLPSTQLVALRNFEQLSSLDQEITRDYFSYHVSPILSPPKESIRKNLSSIAEFLLPREASSSHRNTLFTIKKSFPSLKDSIKITGEDPSINHGPTSISALILSQQDAAIISLSPGFFRIENEVETGQPNANVEVIKSDFYITKAGNAKLNCFHLIKIESNQPYNFLNDGFTQEFDISYTDYEPYLGKKYSEKKLKFGRGVSILISGHVLSFLPSGAIVGSKQEYSESTFGQIEFKARAYKRINRVSAYTAQIVQSLIRNSELGQTATFELVNSFDSYSISLFSQRVSVGDTVSGLSGFKITSLF